MSMDVRKNEESQSTASEQVVVTAMADAMQKLREREQMKRFAAATYECCCQ